MYLLQFPILRRVQYKNVGGHFFGQEYVQTVSRLLSPPFIGRFFLRRSQAKGGKPKTKKEKRKGKAKEREEREKRRKCEKG